MITAKFIFIRPKVRRTIQVIDSRTGKLKMVDWEEFMSKVAMPMDRAKYPKFIAKDLVYVNPNNPQSIQYTKG